MPTMTPTLTTVPRFVAGRFMESSGTTVEDIPDPATGEIIARLPHSSAAEIDEAVRTARRAFPAWADTPAPDRAQVMFRYKQLLEEHFEELAELVVRENGKALAEARGEVRRGIEVVELACGIPTLMMGTSLGQISNGIDEELLRFPVGVVAGITPFNFPMMVPMWMMPLAIVCGNTFVLKPSQRTPLCAIREAELLQQAGLPDGVLNVVHGDKSAVDALLAHPEVDAISFVGSAAVAKYIYATGAAQGKRVQALGGAKNHMIVMDDADLAKTATALISSAFGNAGQRCLAGSVVVAVGGIGDALVGELKAQAEALVLGPGLETKTQMGPVIRAEKLEELRGAIEQGCQAGAQLVTDGRERIGSNGGYFLGPTIFDQVTTEMELWSKELFGPILSVVRAANLEEALSILNRSTYGNAATIFTSSGAHAREFTRRAQAGMLGVNIGVAAPMAFFPFCGWKDSFFGDLHATGADGVRFYTRTKVVTTRWFLGDKLDHTAPEGRGH
jgi:malonate-semialdehyde dehydrogenase (acetylating)/methylmalonate-semialdehyde dehydrogenase